METLNATPCFCTDLSKPVVDILQRREGPIVVICPGTSSFFYRLGQTLPSQFSLRRFHDKLASLPPGDHPVHLSQQVLGKHDLHFDFFHSRLPLQ